MADDDDSGARGARWRAISLLKKREQWFILKHMGPSMSVQSDQ